MADQASGGQAAQGGGQAAGQAAGSLVGQSAGPMLNMSGEPARPTKFITGSAQKFEPKQDKAVAKSGPQCKDKDKKNKPFPAEAKKNEPANKYKAGTPKAGPLPGKVKADAPKNPLQGGVNHKPSGPLKTNIHETPPHTPPGQYTPMTPQTAPLDHPKPPLDHPKPPLTGVLSHDEGKKVFKEIADKKDYIPFDYPDDCCYSRANEMCRILEEKGYPTDKIWIFDPAYHQNVVVEGKADKSVWVKSLTAHTENHPLGQVHWYYHVATVVKVQRPDGTVQDMVVDPSLNPYRMLTPQEWLKLMNNPNAKWAIGHREWFVPGGGSDLDYSATHQRLQEHVNSRARRQKELGIP